MAVLGPTPAADLAERYAVNPIRARLLPAGAAIVEAILDRYGVDELPGLGRRASARGRSWSPTTPAPAWRDRLPELAHGWRA